MSDVNNRRRLRQLWIEPDAILGLLSGGLYQATDNLLPEDVQIAACNYDINKDLFVITLQHESFTPVGIGCDIPLHGPPTIHWSRCPDNPLV